MLYFFFGPACTSALMADSDAFMAIHFLSVHTARRVTAIALETTTNMNTLAAGTDACL